MLQSSYPLDVNEKNISVCLFSAHSIISLNYHTLDICQTFGREFIVMVSELNFTQADTFKAWTLCILIFCFVYWKHGGN